MNPVFEESDFNSDNGMLTSVWGPPLWFSLHTISFNYPVNPTEEDKRRYYKYFKYLGKVLPCGYCRENYSKNLAASKFSKEVFESRNTLSKWVYDLHENVNNMLGKKSLLSYEEVRNRFENFRARCLKKDKPQDGAKEKGCTNPLNGVKSQCILNIVPKDKRKSSFKMDKKCNLTKS
ncbi:Erv1 / Alr family [seawater metagenome]|uniref:thiol oxidase n=1 Tax=seawater metagenome TaxID=1561972 RepID=A0A5E8CLW7_9ZZZZ